MDATEYGYQLLACSLDGTVPRFSPAAKRGEIDGQELTVYYDFQCPYICQSVELVRQYCGERQIPVSLRLVDTQQKAKELPCVFNNWAVFYQGKLQTVNLLDAAALKRMFQREEGRPV